MNKTINEVTAANVTERNLGHELFETRTGIENALIKLEKADTLLSHWVQEYGFNQKPEWYWEYNTIFNFVDMAFDYIIETQAILNKAMEREV